MVKKTIDWKRGAKLEPHTKKKHAILREYFRQYLITRCQLPRQEKFRIAIIDGFSGGGGYECGSYGSPLIFAKVLIDTEREINLYRIDQGMKPINIECLLILNDADKSAIELVAERLAPLLIEAKESSEHLSIHVEYCNDIFENAYKYIKKRLVVAKCRNVFFNLDQCGYSHVTSEIIRDILSSWVSAEVLLTFMIDSMLAYLSPQGKKSGVPLEPEVKEKIDALLADKEKLLGKREWLGEAEKITYYHLKNCSAYVSPFSINNPEGWRYWLMHFANSYRARQVYNDILHQNVGSQAHFGKCGLEMLSYDPSNEGQLYLFDTNSRELAKNALYDDIPRFVAESGDTLPMQEFYAAAYSETPAHSDDIHEMIMLNPDLEVITETGGYRRKPNSIKPSDTLKLKSQTSMYFMFDNPLAK